MELLCTVKGDATEPNKTADAPNRFVPLMTTLVPARPDDGENPVIVGFPKKLELVVKLPLGADTVKGPVITPAGG